MVRSLAALLVSAIALLASAPMLAAQDTEAMATVDIGSHKHLNNAIGLVNKNTVMHSNNMAMAKSNLLVRQDDDVTLELPEGLTLAQETQPLADDAQEQFPMDFRQRFTFNRGGRIVYGWRYPIGYWNRFGRGRFARDCVFNRPFGSFFYC